MNHEPPLSSPAPRPSSPDSRPGRPRFLDDTKRGQLIAIVANGCGVTAAARYLGCHPRTVRRECASDPSFRQQLKRAEFQGQLEPIQNLRKAAKTHWRAAAWMLERSRPYAFTPTKADLFNNDDVNDLIDGINDAIIKALPDRQLADQVIDSIENYVAKKTDDLLHEDPKEKRRRAASRHVKESIARRRRHTNPEPTAAAPEELSDILDGFPLETEEQDTSQYTSEEEIAADAHQLDPTIDGPSQDPQESPLTHPSRAIDDSPFGVPPSGSTVTIHPLPAVSSPTTCSLPPTAYCLPHTTNGTKLTKPTLFCHQHPTKNPTISRCAPRTTEAKSTNFASPSKKHDITDQTQEYTRLPAAFPSRAAHPHTHHPNQPYSPLNIPSPLQSPSQIQIVPPRPRVRRFTKRALARRLNELEMQVHKTNMAVAQVAAMLEQLAAPDQPARTIGFCPSGNTPPPTASSCGACGPKPMWTPRR
jgi:hypothetical protein